MSTKCTNFNLSAYLLKLAVCLTCLIIFTFSSGFAIRNFDIKLNENGSGEFGLSISFLKKHEAGMKEVEILQTSNNGNEGKNVWDYLVSEAIIQKADLKSYGFDVTDVNNDQFVGYLAVKKFANAEQLANTMTLSQKMPDGTTQITQITPGKNEDFDLAKKYSSALIVNQAAGEYSMDLNLSEEFDKNRNLLNDVLAKKLLTKEQMQDYQANLRMFLYAAPKVNNATASGAQDGQTMLTWNLLKTKSLKFSVAMKSDSSMGWLWIVLLLIVLLIVGGGLAYFLKSKKDTTTALPAGDNQKWEL